MAETRDIVTGRLSRVVVRLAGPAVLSMFVETLLSLGDTFWVGKLGPEGVAAITAASYIIWVLFSLVEVPATGVISLVAQAVGAGDRERAIQVFWNGWVFALLIAFGLYVLLPFLEPVLRFMHLMPGVRQEAWRYLAITLLGMPVMALFQLHASALQGYGDTKTPFRATTFAVVLNLALDPFLIFGLGPLPRMGVAGAALASVLARTVGTGIMAIALRGYGFRFPQQGWRPEGAIFRRLFGIGFPPSLNGVLFSLIYVGVTRIVAGFGTEALAALGIGNRIESFAYLTSWGFSIAAAATVGQNLGAGQPQRARLGAWIAVGYASLIVGLWSLTYITIPEWLGRVFVSDPLTLAHTRDYLFILFFSQIPMAVTVVLEGAFAGAGHTLPPLLISVPLTAMRIPLSLFLGHRLGWGARGVWWAITLTTIAVSGLMVLWWERRTWEKATHRG